MRKFIVNIATGILENIVLVDPQDLPTAPVGYRMEDDTGGKKGQVRNGLVWEEALPTAQESEEQYALRLAKIKRELYRQGSTNEVLLKISFLQENRIRLLEGRPEVTASQFRTWVENQID